MYWWCFIGVFSFFTIAFDRLSTCTFEMLLFFLFIHCLIIVLFGFCSCSASASASFFPFPDTLYHSFRLIIACIWNFIVCFFFYQLWPHFHFSYKLFFKDWKWNLRYSQEWRTFSVDTFAIRMSIKDWSTLNRRCGIYYWSVNRPFIKKTIKLNDLS